MGEKRKEEREEETNKKDRVSLLESEPEKQEIRGSKVKQALVGSLPSVCLTSIKTKNHQPPFRSTERQNRQTEGGCSGCYRKCRRYTVGEGDGQNTVYFRLLCLPCYLADACHPKQP